MFLNTLLIALLTFIVIYTHSLITIPFLITYISFYLYNYKKSALILPIILIGSFVTNYNPSKDDYNKEWEHEVIVSNVYSSSITVIEDGEEYYVYNVHEHLSKGDKITFEGKYYQNSNKGSFDIFVHSTGSIASVRAVNESIHLESAKSNLRNNIHANLYEEKSWYSDLTLLLLYGEETDRGNNMKNTIDYMGISHLFVISGFHITLFYLLLEKGGRKFIRNRKLISILSFSISLGFLYLVYFPPTGIRALLTLLLIRTHRWDKIESLSIAGLIFFVINPWLMLTNSMILSFSITMAIYIYRPLDILFLDTVVLSMFAFYIALPTISTWENEHNLLAPLLAIVMTPIVSCLYVLCLILLPFNNIWILINPIFHLIWIVIYMMSTIHIKLNTPEMGYIKQITLTVICVYYIYLLRFEKEILLGSFFSISLILFLI